MAPLVTDIAAALRAHFAAAPPAGVVSAYLFGSHGRGTPHRDSDVDVALLFDRAAVSDRGERARRAVRLAAALVGATHRNAVDVVVLNDAPPELAVAAVSGAPVYAVDPEADHAFVRTVRLRLGDLRPFLDRNRRVKLEALAR